MKGKNGRLHGRRVEKWQRQRGGDVGSDWQSKRIGHIIETKKTKPKEKNSQEHTWHMENRRKRMHSVCVVRLPGQYRLLVRPRGPQVGRRRTSTSFVCQSPSHHLSSAPTRPELYRTSSSQFSSTSLPSSAPHLGSSCKRRVSRLRSAATRSAKDCVWFPVARASSARSNGGPTG